VISPPRPAISVLLPCRDAAPYLDECIASLESQTEPRFEVLTLDDGSRDDTPAMLGAWAERDARVRVVPREGVGIVAALNRLAAAARAPLLARMDADDVAYPTRFERQSALLASRPEIAACGTGVRYVPPDAAGSGSRRYERWINGLTSPEAVDRDLFVECPIAHPTLMIRRKAFEVEGGYREGPWPEDYELILRLARRRGRLTNVPEVLHEWRLGPDRLSLRSRRYSPDAFRSLKVRFLAGGVVPHARPLVVWGAGRVGKAFARAWLAGGDGRPVDRFIDLDPRKIGQVIHDAEVILPRTFEEGVRGRRPPPYVLIAVGSPGARGEVRDALGGLGFAEIADYRAVA